MMNIVLNGLQAIWGLFVDDEFLAIAILIVVGLTAFHLTGFHAYPLAAGGFLFASILLVLVIGVLRTARK